MRYIRESKGVNLTLDPTPLSTEDRKMIGSVTVSSTEACKKEELKQEIAKGWDGPDSGRSVKDIIASKNSA